jgi:hypothetical protein
VEGLDVVDFPGVDDEDDSIGDLADLLLTIAQIVVFVVDYRYNVMHVYFPIHNMQSHLNLMQWGEGSFLP